MNVHLFVAFAVFSFLAVAFCDDCSEAGECSASQTCCPTPDQTTVSCCPLQNGVCCSDHSHCCPSGYYCDANGGSCIPGGPQTTTPSSGGGTTCSTSSSVNADARQAMLNSNNAYRSKLINGRQPDYYGTMNQRGRNMYKLAWDCELERQAQAWSDACVYAHSSSSQRNGAGENLYAQYGKPMDARSNFIGAADSWWEEATTEWTARANNVFSSSDINAGHFTQMAWGKTYKVGCGMSACRGIFGSNVAAYVVCRYVVAGNLIGAQVYEPGSPCSSSNPCSTAIPSTCEVSSGLCVIGSSQKTLFHQVIFQEKLQVIKHHI